MNHAQRMEQFEQTDLYVVITEHFCAGRTALDVLEDCLEAGVKLVQFREKEMDSMELYARALAFRQHTAEAGALLIINDRIDIAQAVEADGVHLGQNDLPMVAARALAPDLILGASTHDLEEAKTAQKAGASYVNIGPIFDTNTKAVATGTVGPEMIDQITPDLKIPWTCMGGIKAHNIDTVLQRGAKHVAIVTAVTAAPDVRAAAEELRAKMKNDR